MATREVKLKVKAKAPTESKLRAGTNEAPESASEPFSQVKRAESRFLLQVDRQTKQSYASPEAAEEAGLAIKTAHPVVQVAVYDSVEQVSKVIAPK
jgi:hypothetical protein